MKIPSHTAIRRAIMGAAALALAAGPALAHHSFAMFDTAHPATMTGTVKQFDWTNPHAFLWVYADPKAGESPVLWNFETSNPGNLTRAGWTKSTFKPGDKVKIIYDPLRSGAAAGQLAKTTQLSTGKTYDLTPIPLPSDTAGGK